VRPTMKSLKMVLVMRTPSHRNICNRRSGKLSLILRKRRSRETILAQKVFCMTPIIYSWIREIAVIQCDGSYRRGFSFFALK
jgi:hypothetical protein